MNALHATSRKVGISCSDAAVCCTFDVQVYQKDQLLSRLLQLQMLAPIDDRLPWLPPQGEGEKTTMWTLQGLTYRGQLAADAGLCPWFDPPSYSHLYEQQQQQERQGEPQQQQQQQEGQGEPQQQQQERQGEPQQQQQQEGQGGPPLQQQEGQGEPQQQQQERQGEPQQQQQQQQDGQGEPQQQQEGQGGPPLQQQEGQQKGQEQRMQGPGEPEEQQQQEGRSSQPSSQQQQQTKQLHHMLLHARLINPRVHLPWLELVTLIQQQLKEEPGMKLDDPTSHYSDVIQQAVQECSTESIEGLPELLLLDGLFGQSPGEWWRVNGCGFNRSGKVSDQQQEEEQQQQGQEGTEKQQQQRQQQQNQQASSSSGGGCSSSAGPSAQPLLSSRVQGKSHGSLPTVSCSAEEPCDWCRGPCSNTSSSNKQEQGAAAYGCSLCGLARYCSEGCAKAARPCHDKNCW